MKKIRVVIFDDNKSRRDSLRMLISLYEDLEFAGAYEDCGDVIRAIGDSTPDVVLMDIEMPHVDGIQGVSAIRKEYPNWP
ncbi:MAG: response regulator transcription factor [Flavobacteriales bacterium]